MPAKLLKLPPPIVESWEWQRHAACRSVDTSLFYYLDNERGDPRDWRLRHAKRVCRKCPVKEACLRHALEANETHGVWGGLSEEERRQLRRSSGQQVT